MYMNDYYWLFVDIDYFHITISIESEYKTSCTNNPPNWQSFPIEKSPTLFTGPRCSGGEVKTSPTPQPGQGSDVSGNLLQFAIENDHR